jgi:hypothetical protein
MAELAARRAAAAAAGDGWACIVFVKTRLMALVLERLARSLPRSRGALRARAFLGHNTTGGAEDGVMSVPVRRECDRWLRRSLLCDGAVHGLSVAPSPSQTPRVCLALM